MKPKSAEKGLPAPEKGLREELWKRVRELLTPRLKAYLRFASLDEVLQLVQHQFNHIWDQPEGVQVLLREQPTNQAQRETWLQTKAQARSDLVAWVDRSPTTFPIDPPMDVVPIARRLRDRRDAVSVFLYTRLSSTTRAALDNWRGPGSDLGMLSISLVNSLNEVVEGTCIYEPSIFRTVELRSETRCLLGRNELGRPCPRLNRLLLEDAYSAELPREQLNVATYVKDFDRVREYLHPSTSPQRRQEIRGAFWEQYQGWVADKLLAMFQNQFPDVSPDEPRLQIAADWAQDRVFAEDRFEETAKKYTAEGKTFASFIEFLLIRRCLDAVKEFASEPESCPLGAGAPAPLGLGPPDTRDAVADESEMEELTVNGGSTDEDEPVPAAELLKRRLSALRDRTERAVVDLRYRAYLNPSLDLIANWTLNRIAQSVSLEQLQEAFETDQEKMRKLQDEEIPNLETERQQADACREARQAALEIQGWDRRRISRLRTFHTGTIEELETQMKNRATPAKRRQELDFQIACIRYQKALNRLQVARERLERYKRLRFPWVRTQEEIGGLLQMSQETVCKRLKKALRKMREHGTWSKWNARSSALPVQ